MVYVHRRVDHLGFSSLYTILGHITHLGDDICGAVEDNRLLGVGGGGRGNVALRGSSVDVRRLQRLGGLHGYVLEA